MGLKRKSSGKKKVSGINRLSAEEKIQKYLDGGRVPWSEGYREYKMRLISNTVSEIELLESFAEAKIPKGFGIGIDERCVEYPWAMGKLLRGKGPVLDAGSSFNFEELIDHPLWVERKLTIAGLSVEKRCYYSRGISYQFCDLRELPFRDGFFEAVASVSTLEHIDMNNSLYGHGDGKEDTEEEEREMARSFEYLQAVREICRVTNPRGEILITVPVGRFERHDFFQQFDEGMIGEMKAVLSEFGEVCVDFFRYLPTGWIRTQWEECDRLESHNPHTGVGTGSDGAAHSRAIACIKATGRG